MSWHDMTWGLDSWSISFMSTSTSTSKMYSSRVHEYTSSEYFRPCLICLYCWLHFQTCTTRGTSHDRHREIEYDIILDIQWLWMIHYMSTCFEFVHSLLPYPQHFATKRRILQYSSVAVIRTGFNRPSCARIRLLSSTFFNLNRSYSQDIIHF